MSKRLTKKQRKRKVIVELVKEVIKDLIIIGVIMGAIVFFVDSRIERDGLETRERPGKIAVTTPKETTAKVTTTTPITTTTVPVITTAVETTTTTISTKYDEDLSYFDDAIFIGNSRTQGLFLYTGLSSTSYTYQGLKVDTVFTEKVINMNGQKITIADAVKQNHNFSKAYIMLGINELGWKVRSLYVEKYKEIIAMIREVNPNAVIYVQSILPVTQVVSEKDKVYNMTNIREFNQLLKDMCRDTNTIYLNVSEAVEDTNGYLPEEASSDGIHLNRSYCFKWLEYLRTHTTEKTYEQ